MDPTLLQALIEGDAPDFQKFVDANPNCLYTRTAQNNTALHIAASRGHVFLVVEIFSRCPELLATANSKGDTPLHCAAKVGQEFVLSYLIGHWKQYAVEATDVICAKNMDGNTALHEAVHGQHLRAARELVIADRQLTTLLNNSGESPLYLAAERGSLEIVQLLLQWICSGNGPNGQNALHAAVCRNYDISKLLLDKKQDLVRQADALGSSPLHYAVSMGDVMMVQLLLDHDASAAYLSDKNGNSPIHVASSMGYIDIIKYVLRKCPDAVELVDNNGKNLLHVAVEKKRSEVVKQILNMSALKQLINEPDSDGNTPIHLAVMNHNREILSFFLADHRADTTLRNKKGLTPLDISSLCLDSSIRLRMHRITVSLVAAGSQFSPQRMDFVTNKLQRNREEELSRCRMLANNLAIVAVLIATVTFAAAFTLPGGYDNNNSANEGMAILTRKAAFKVFLISDTIAMVSAVTVTCLLIYTGSSDHDVRLHAISSAVKLMWVALGGMVVAFAMGIYVVVISQSKWLAILICIIAFFFPLVSWAIISWSTITSIMPRIEAVGKYKKRKSRRGAVFSKVVDIQTPPSILVDFETPQASQDSLSRFQAFSF